MKIDQLVIELSKDPFNPTLNFEVAVEYEKQNQTASAVSFYLRTAEYGLELHPSLVYTSLLKVAHCFDDQNDRQGTVSNCLLQAVGYLPYRPEAYFLLAQFHERIGQWQECYTWAQLGLHQQQYSPLPIAVGYEGQYVLTFEKAVSAYWIGRKDESIELLIKLSEMKDITPLYKSAVQNNLNRLSFNGADFATDFPNINPLEPAVTNYRKFFGDTADLVIDIGSREGDDGVYLAEKLRSKRIIAIDANPQAIELARQAHPNIEIHYTAVSDFDGAVIFHQVVSDDIELAGCSSMADKERTMFPEHFEGKMRQITVPAIRMDSFLKQQNIKNIIDVVKIDTEGFSWQVLQGFGDRLKDVKLLHVETERESHHDKHVLSDAITKFMKAQGFELVDISYEWGWGIQDQVWVNPELVTTTNKICFS